MWCLFSLLEGPACPSAKVQLIPQVLCFLSSESLNRHDPDKSLQVIIFWTLSGFLGVPWQQGPLLWVHKAFSDLHKVTSKFEQTFRLGSNPQKLVLRTYNHEPDKIILPFSLKHSQPLWDDSIRFQEMVNGFPCIINNHPPQDRRIITL